MINLSQLTNGVSSFFFSSSCSFFYTDICIELMYQTLHSVAFCRFRGGIAHHFLARKLSKTANFRYWNWVTALEKRQYWVIYLKQQQKVRHFTDSLTLIGLGRYNIRNRIFEHGNIFVFQCFHLINKLRPSAANRGGIKKYVKTLKCLPYPNQNTRGQGFCTWHMIWT